MIAKYIEKVSHCLYRIIIL